MEPFRANLELIRARLVLPLTRPAIDDGAVLVRSGRLEFVGRWADAPRPTEARRVDLGEVILLPGLINAHAHLDYTQMAGLIRAGQQFTDWLKGLVELKASWTLEQFAASWQAGAQMLLRNGVTTVVNMEAVPELIPDQWRHTPLRLVSMRELIGFKDPAAAAALVETAVAQWAGLPDGHRQVGLAPHAPYSTCGELVRAAAAAARARGWRLSTHVAESEPEYLMFTAATGPMFQWLKSQRDVSDCGSGTPVQWLARQGYLGPDLLAVHCNYLGPDDPALLARSGASVVHCPRSHAYFGHAPFPWRALAQVGVNLCLGTDSLASVVAPPGMPIELDLFAEMQALAAAEPELPPERILEMATVNPARALGTAGQLGELTEGAWADWIALPFTGGARQAVEAVIHHTGPVAASQIAGQWVWGPLAPDQGLGQHVAAAASPGKTPPQGPAGS